MSAIAAESLPEPKDHALFSGASLQVEQEGRTGEVDGVTREAVRIVTDGQHKLVPLEAMASGRIVRSLKLSDTIATIAKMRSERRYTTDGEAESQLGLEAMMGGSAGHARDVFSREESAAAIERDRAYLQEQADQGFLNRQSGEPGSSETYERVGKHAAKSSSAEGPDAVLFTCEVSAPRSSRDAFLLVIFEYRDDVKEKTIRPRVCFQMLDTIGPKKQDVRIGKGGFPKGFVLEKTLVHLYVDGQEVATNVSERRVELTADEALRILTANYIASHPKDTLAAVPQKMVLPVGFKEKANAAVVARPLYATVGLDGAVLSVSASETGAVPTDPYIDGVIRQFRFNPALKEGKPVESVVAIQLSKYVR